MIRVVLKPREVRELEGVLRRADDRKLRDRVQIVLMTHLGRPREQVAADPGATPRTVRRHLNAYLDRGLDGLRPRKAPGPAARVPDALAAAARGWVVAGPAACGARFANRTHEALAAHLGRVRGTGVRKSAMPAYCRRHEIRPYRPTYRHLRGDAGKPAAASGDLAALNKGRRGAGRPCWRRTRTRRGSRWCRPCAASWASRGTGRWWGRGTTRACCTCSAASTAPTGGCTRRRCPPARRCCGPSGRPAAGRG